MLGLSLIGKLFFPPPASAVVTAMTAISFLSMSAGWKEIKGESMQYSKMWKDNEKKAKVPSKIGMLVLYTPAFLAGVSSFLLFPDADLRFNLVRSAVTTHFLKRILEVMFVHKYSGSMATEAVVPISAGYFLTSATMIYNQYLIQTLPEPSIDLKYIGIPIFLLGIGGNFYHHYLLSKLRTEGDKNYKIPKGGLFSVVICPHYLFEIMGFWGISLISQSVYSLSSTMGMTFYLMGRSYSTRKWYVSKFEDFPKDVKALIPYFY